MDIVTGLSALGQAIGIAKDLREIGRTYDEATFKLKASELQIALADAKMALSDARIELAERAEQLGDLKKELDVARNGDFCPKCRSGRMHLVSTSRHHMHALGHFGVEDWTFRCSDTECAFEPTRLHDPHGAVQAQAKKR